MMAGQPLLSLGHVESKDQSQRASNYKENLGDLLGSGMTLIFDLEKIKEVM